MPYTARIGTVSPTERGSTGSRICSVPSDTEVGSIEKVETGTTGSWRPRRSSCPVRQLRSLFVDRDPVGSRIRAGVLRRRRRDAGELRGETVRAVLPEGSRKPGEGPQDPSVRRDRERSDPQSERSRRSRLLEVLREGEVPSGLPLPGGIMASTEAGADQSKGEDIVHASWRHGGQREQGSRTGRCGWITSFLRSFSCLFGWGLLVDLSFGAVWC